MHESEALKPRDAITAAGLVLLFMLPMAMGLMPVLRQGHLWSITGGVAIQTVATFGAVFIVLRRRRIGWESLGWSGKTWLVAAGAASGVALYFAVQVAGWALSHLSHPLPASRTLLDSVIDQGSVRSLLLFILVAGVLAPVGEELFFRGVLYTALRNRYGILASVVVSAAVFALLHGEWTAMAVPIWLAGVILAFVYQTTGSLVAPMVAHCVHNILTALVAYFIAR